MTLREQAGEGAGNLAGALRDQGDRYLRARKARAAEEIEALGQALRLAADKLHDRDVNLLGDYLDSAADGIDRVARSLEERDLAELAGDIEEFARQRPAVILGGVFLAGLALGRVARAAQTNSSPRRAKRARR